MKTKTLVIFFTICFLWISSSSFGQNKDEITKKEFEIKADKLNCILANFLIQTSSLSKSFKPINCSGICFDCDDTLTIKSKLKNAKPDNEKIGKRVNDIKVHLLSVIGERNANELFSEFKDSIIQIANEKRKNNVPAKFESSVREIYLEIAVEKPIAIKTVEKPKTEKPTINVPQPQAVEKSSTLNKVWFWSSIVLNFILAIGLVVIYKMAREEIDGLKESLKRAEIEIKSKSKDKSFSKLSERNEENFNFLSQELRDELTKQKGSLASQYPEKLVKGLSEISDDDLRNIAKENGGNKTRILEFIKAQQLKELDENLKKNYFEVELLLGKYNMEEFVKDNKFDDFPNLTTTKINDILSEKLSLFIAELKKTRFVEKRELEKNHELLVLNIRQDLKKLHDEIKYVNKYSQQPSIEGYFVNDKLSESQLPHHLYKIEIFINQPDAARFSILSDNERAIKTAIQSYSNYLVPVCILENDNTSGTKAEMVGPDGYGKLKLEGDKWKCIDKLKIKIS